MPDKTSTEQKEQTQEFIFDELDALSSKVKTTEGVPDPLRERVHQMLRRLDRMAKLGHYASEFDTLSRYIEVVTSIPWVKTTKDKLDIEHAKEMLDKNHYGMPDVK